MKNKDWFFTEDNKIFNFRSTGILVNENKILIQRGVDDKCYALPGGHVAWGETSAESLKREFKEETGTDIIVDKLVWVEEIFWKWGDKKVHTICHYHVVSFKDKTQIPQIGTFKSLASDESRLIFEWVEISKLSNILIYPVFLKRKLPITSNTIEHFVSKD